MSDSDLRPQDEIDSWFECGLREALRAQPPQPSPAASRTGRHYQVIDELGRGGMGVVMRARDQALGRDIAIKMMHDRHCKSAALIQRFVEEAQVCGQLQHPGVVPVYDLGDIDGRPFFTMKLIEGHTLEQLLAGRQSLAADRQRLLRVFEQVCLTMAYAHSRGVIHRDLKPANVMVGAFGEVQIMDWGLAKVLPAGAASVAAVRGNQRSDSDPGSVLGTPRYMPPEQARGDIASMDERSDVFALGAILCEILSGEPPYTGLDQDVLACARACATQEAQARLESSDQPQLIALTRKCLAHDMERRPRSARALADDIASHLASAERRAEQARFRIMSARRAQRLTLVFAAALVLLLALGGGGWLIAARQQDRMERMNTEAQAKRMIQDDLDSGNVLLRQASGSGPEDPAYDKAEAVFERARENARTAAVPGLVGMADACLTQVVDGRRLAEHRGALERVQIPQNHCVVLGITSNREARRRCTEYQRVFAELGSKVLEDPPGTVADFVTGNALHSEMVAALDDWALAALTIARWPDGKTDKSLDAEKRLQADRLLRFADGADADTAARRIRNVLREDHPTAIALAGLFVAEESRELKLPCALLLAKSLRTFADTEGAIELLISSETRYPGDVWLSFQKALSYEALPLPDWSKAIHEYEVAREAARRACRGTDVLAISIHRAYALAKSGQPALAEREIHEAIDLALRAGLATNANAQNALGLIKFEQGELDPAVVLFRLSMRDPTCTTACSNLINALFLLGRKKDALQEAEALGPRGRFMAAMYKVIGDIYVRDRSTLADACAQYEEAVRLQPDFGAALYALALARRSRCEFPEALDCIERAGNCGYQSPERWEPSLREDLQSAADSPRRRVLAELAGQRFAAAARICGADPSAADVLTPQGWDTVCAELLAVQGGRDASGASSEEQQQWRNHALGQLRAGVTQLATIAKQVDQRGFVEAHLRRWQLEPCLVSMREQESRSLPSETERTEWSALWYEVDRLLPPWK